MMRNGNWETSLVEYMMILLFGTKRPSPADWLLIDLGQ